MENRQVALGGPCRIQRRRTKGWRAPDRATYVGRGSRWGNPYVIKQCGPTHAVIDSRTGGVIYSGTSDHDARRVAVTWYRAWLSSQPGLLAAARRQLAGRDLMCWCPFPEPGEPDHCHAAVLLEIANPPASAPAEESTVGPRCGNNPNARLTPSDRQAVKEFREYLARRRAGGPPEQNPFTTSKEA